MENTELKLRELALREKELELQEKELDNKLKIVIIENLQHIGNFNYPDEFFKTLFNNLKKM